MSVWTESSDESETRGSEPAQPEPGTPQRGRQYDPDEVGSAAWPEAEAVPAESEAPWAADAAPAAARGAAETAAAGEPGEGPEASRTDAEPGMHAAARPRRRSPLRTIAVGLLGVAVGAGSMLGLPAYRALASSIPQLQTVPVTPTQQAAGSPAVAVYKALSPSVVLVMNQSTVNGFYGQKNQTAWGSGVIFEPNGYIVTNDHVVAGAQKVTVTLKDGKSYPAKVVGGDPATDLAVIKISTNHALPVAKFANSNDVVPGEMAIAIGNPLGPQFADTVTQGVVGAMRPMLYGLPGSTPRVTKMIQVDAPINPGNSGGALANVQGEVIGITSMKVPQTGEMNVPAIGLGFAIPSNTVRHIVNEILQNGKVAHAWIGVVIRPTPPNALPDQTQTLTITSVQAGSPAAAAGLQAGDVILGWNGKHMRNYYDLVEAINQSNPGDKVALGIDRNGKPVTVEVTLGSEPKNLAQPTAAHKTQSQSPAPSGLIPQLPFPFPSFGGH